MSFWAGRRVLVTGGAGFIGWNLTRRLLEVGARVRMVDNLARAAGREPELSPTPAEIEFCELDLRDPQAGRQACQGCEVVFHFAARAGSLGYYQQHPGKVLRENLLMDAQLVEAALATGVEAFFYPSSSMLYPLERQQTPDSPALKEEDALPANPPNSYGWAKLVGEQVVAQAAGENGLRVAILRLENVYGPGQDTDLERGSIIPVLARRALEYPRVLFQLRGRGRETRCYVYVSDAVEAMLRAVEALERQPVVGPLNLSGPERVSMLELAGQIARLAGKELEPVLLPGETRIWGQVLDSTRACAQLDWRPRVSLPEGLRRTLEYVETKLAREAERVQV
ncbi:MAG: NAD-dependent epimerase/dehydratase family protein [Candidatus Acidoferrales bacterium]